MTWRLASETEKKYIFVNDDLSSPSKLLLQPSRKF